MSSVNELLTAIQALRRFIGSMQLDTLVDATRGEEGPYFRKMILDLYAITNTMPKTYEQDGKGDEAVVWLHYFGPSYDVWITERDCEPVQHQAFGLVDLYQDGGELGYCSIVEIIRAGAEIDLHWTPKTLREIRAKLEAA